MTDIKTEVERYARGAIDDATNLRSWAVGYLPKGSMNAIRDGYGLDEESDWIDLLNNMALEVYGTARVTHERKDLQSVTVVTGTGGPHVEFEVDMDDNVTGRAIWGSDSAEKFDTLPGLFDALAPLVGGEA